MINKLKVPFYGNTEDNTHCYQACFKTILKYYFPNNEYSWEELDRLTGKKKDKWTWPMRGWVNLSGLGLEVKYIGTFDYEKFISFGKEYLFDLYGEEVARSQIENSDIPYEIETSKELLGKFIQEKRVPELTDITKHLKDGWFVMANVNYYPLYGKSGYAGHFVIILDMDKEVITVHDPGLPHKSFENIEIYNFLEAWNYSGVENRGLTLVRKNN